MKRGLVRRTANCELRGIVFGLFTAGYTPRAIELGDAPDSRVSFDDSDVWVEFAEIVDPASARYTNMMSNLNRDVKDDVEGDPVARAAIRGHHLEFRLGLCPSKGDVRGLRREFIEFIRSGEHAKSPARSLDPLTQPMSKQAKTTMYRADWPHGATGGNPHILNIQAAAHSFSPLSLARIGFHRLERKRHAGFRYGMKPLWLVLSVTDLRGTWDESMAAFSSACPTIEPYERVIICSAWSAVIWADGLVAVKDCRRS